jgi:hypothetical protein
VIDARTLCQGAERVVAGSRHLGHQPESSDRQTGAGHALVEELRNASRRKTAVPAGVLAHGTSTLMVFGNLGR